ncbi:hypothetical protein [Defluviimonas sp. WL0075]|uniref:Uncharacterized protein n=1 Tax=Albidovulum sediminicola TaxID=2984331 RepID=A0ABT2YY21_9RHOB|nr:hypothetical protein [Defluviimonas sp. WL0075]MCV2863662.1 hypothetical protein [Defluviimonas sp. WL0075]
MRAFKIAIAAMLLAGTAHAGGGNSGAAQNMVEDLRAGLGSAAPTVSGKDFRSASGWGNNGSALVSGDRVSDYKK